MTTDPNPYPGPDPDAHQDWTMNAPTDLTLPEELLLTALDPERGRVPGDRRFLRWGLAAAVLMDLEATGRVASERGRIVLVRAVPTGTPLLDDALATLEPAKRGGIRTQRWLGSYAQRAEYLSARSLADRGLIRTETHRVLRLFPVVRHRVLDPHWRAHRLSALVGTPTARPTDPRSLALAALLKSTKLATKLGVPRTVRKEMRPLVRQFWQTEAVRKKVASAQSAAASGGDGGGGGE